MVAWAVWELSLTGPGQGWTQVAELVLAFVLSAVVGLEREARGKAAGLRTQTIVGTASALIVLVSKYGFSDVLGPHVALDPSRVAAQIVSGIGFLGAGLIITRQGAVRGLTTAAAVWETAAIGMAAGAGLPLLAVIVTILHFVVVLGFARLVPRMPGRIVGSVRVHLTYPEGQGILRAVLNTCASHGWSLIAMTSDRPGASRDDDEVPPNRIAVLLTLTGRGVHEAVQVLAGVDGVDDVARSDQDE
jgi:putative Mg2+ transporter-C (MgtC) family protein